MLYLRPTVWHSTIQYWFSKEIKVNKGVVIINWYWGWRNQGGIWVQAFWGGRGQNLSASTLRGGQNLSAAPLENPLHQYLFPKVLPLARQVYPCYTHLIAYQTLCQWTSVHRLWKGASFQNANAEGGKFSVRQNLVIPPPPVQINNDRSLILGGVTWKGP